MQFLDVVSDGRDVLLQQYVIVCNLDWLDKKEIICIQCHLSTIGQRKLADGTDGNDKNSRGPSTDPCGTPEVLVDDSP